MAVVQYRIVAFATRRGRTAIRGAAEEESAETGIAKSASAVPEESVKTAEMFARIRVSA